MIHGIYLSAQGANNQSLRHDVLANNLANASTTGFKKDVPIFQVHRPDEMRDDVPLRMVGDRQNSVGAVSIAEITTIHESGPIEPTERELDIALSGNGFLHVSDGTDGYLTRNGRLSRSQDGQLVTEDTGLQVLNTGGTPIQIPDDIVRIDINTDGTIVEFDANNDVVVVDQLDLVVAPHDQLQKIGDSLFRVAKDVLLEPALDQVTVQQKAIEASGVDPVKEIPTMIESSRFFEANINMIRMQDESLSRLLQAVSG